jgi:hypothetical protein
MRRMVRAVCRSILSNAARPQHALVEFSQGAGDSARGETAEEGRSCGNETKETSMCTVYVSLVHLRGGWEELLPTLTLPELACMRR